MQNNKQKSSFIPKQSGAKSSSDNAKSSRNIPKRQRVFLTKDAVAQAPIKVQGNDGKKQNFSFNAGKSAPLKSNKPQSGGKKLPSVKIIPLGGLGEIGKNLTMYEYDNEAILVDCGMTFPDDDMPGVDIVIPDFAHILKNKSKIKGLFLTHGHEDHIGAIPYLLKDFNVPIYGTKLTLGLVEGKLKEHKLLSSAKLKVVKSGDRIPIGTFTVEFIHVNHSIPDSTALAIKTPAGTIIQTGDFKIDTTPIGGKMMDLARLGQLGKEGVLALLSDSTNAERSGYAMSEGKVGETFASLFKQAGNKRIIVASFSSNIHRIQQIVDEAVRVGRVVCVNGRSMINVVGIAKELGYLKIPNGVLVEIDALKKLPPEKVVLITTGSQGEPMSALYRMAFGEHRQVHVGPSDTIIVSATPIPGNEKLVSRVINELMKQGAHVVYEKMYDVHVSGHACQEELKLLLGLVNPVHFIPVHGEHRQLVKHAALAKGMGVAKENILIPETGNVIELNQKSMKIIDKVPHGKLLVDGLGVGDVGSIVLRDRKLLADDGIIIAAITLDSATGEFVAGPQIETRGFIYVKENEKLMDEIFDVACKALDICRHDKIRDYNGIRMKIKDILNRFLWEKTKRSPMILPIITTI